MAYLSEYKRTILQGLKDNFIEYHNEDEKLSIGEIVISIVPLDDRYFLPCDGRILDSYNDNYKELYEAIGDIYKSEANRVLEVGEFCIPKAEGITFRMIDPTGKLDETRELGEEKTWGLPKSMKTDFNLNDQDRFVKNTQKVLDNIDGTDGIDTTPLHIVGAFVHSNFESKQLRYKANGGGEPRVGSKIRFKEMTAYSYIKYKSYLL